MFISVLCGELAALLRRHFVHTNTPNSGACKPLRRSRVPPVCLALENSPCLCLIHVSIIFSNTVQTQKAVVNHITAAQGDVNCLRVGSNLRQT